MFTFILELAYLYIWYSMLPTAYDLSVAASHILSRLTLLNMQGFVRTYTFTRICAPTMQSSNIIY